MREQKQILYPRERGPLAKIGGWADIRGISIVFTLKKFKYGYQSRARVATIPHQVSLTIAVLSGRGYDR